MSHVFDPSLEVEFIIREWKTPPLNNSIFTFSDILSVQVRVCVVPASQFSPPLGEITVIPPVKIVKSLFERSNRMASTTLVILTL